MHGNGVKIISYMTRDKGHKRIEQVAYRGMQFKCYALSLLTTNSGMSVEYKQCFQLPILSDGVSVAVCFKSTTEAERLDYNNIIT